MLVVFHCPLFPQTRDDGPINLYPLLQEYVEIFFVIISCPLDIMLLGHKKSVMKIIFLYISYYCMHLCINSPHEGSIPFHTIFSLHTLVK